MSRGGGHGVFATTLIVGGVLLVGTMGPCAFGLTNGLYGDAFPFFFVVAGIPTIVGLGAIVVGLIILARSARSRDGR